MLSHHFLILKLIFLLLLSKIFIVIRGIIILKLKVFFDIYFRSFLDISINGLKMKILSSNFIFDLIFLNELKPFKPDPLNNLIKKFSNKSSL